MHLDKVVDNIGTVLELKRVSSAYVIDYRALSEPEIRDALKKTAPQYYHVNVGPKVQRSAGGRWSA